MKRKLEVIYIAPARYDDDGYVHRYWRGVVPSNSLSCLRSITQSVAANGELGEDVEVNVTTYDDCVERPPIKRIIRMHKRGKAQVLVGFVGVQSNQFMRASDLALELRAAGVPVMIGGFHVSGMLAMFDEPSLDLQRLLDQGVTLVKGEVEGPGVMASILRDAVALELKPIYNITEWPDLAKAMVPKPDPNYLKKFLLPGLATLDTSRGCPFRCSFCTIINVQGKRMRCRSADAILKSIEENWDAGVRDYFFTDDNLSRSHVWEEVFDGLKEMAERGKKIVFMMQVDTQAYRIPNFVDKAQAAGCHMVFVGMETVNPKNVEATGKNQNDTETYAKMVQTWHDAHVRVHVGYIIGLPHDTTESIREDVETLRNHVLVDEASFFMLTPLPGSEDHRNMVQNGIPIDADLNNLDSNHETFRHPNFKPGEWRAAYYEAWNAFYSKEHILHILIRAPRSEYWGLFWTSLWYRWATVFVHTHPMGTGLFRLKDRKSRRPIFPRESVWRYAWRRLGDVWWGAKVYAQLFIEFQEIWMLSRKPDDPRWATLAELRMQWAEMQLRISQSSIAGRCDVAAQEMHTMLSAASNKLQTLAGSGKDIGGRTSRKLRGMAQDAEAYLKSFEKQVPTRASIAKAHDYISQNIVAGYEELAIRYVAKRRKFNQYRQELLEWLRSGRAVGRSLLLIPRMVMVEFLLAVRFIFTALRQSV